jgi:phage protein D
VSLLGPPTPTYRLTIDGRDITPRIEGRLESLTLTDNRGFEADQLEITLDDSDGLLTIPPRGATLKLALGWEGSPLVDKGTFTIDEVEHSGAPDKLTLRARSADLRVGLSTKREKSWHNQTLGAIVGTIAARHGLIPVVGPEFIAQLVEHIDQTAESDVNLLTRLAEMFDAIATVKADRLLFVKAGHATTASGVPIPPLLIQRKSGDSHRFAIADREIFTGVRAYYQSTAKAKKGEVLVGCDEGSSSAESRSQTAEASADNVKVLRHTYASESNAWRAAKATWARIQRGKAEFSITLAEGRPELFPEVPVIVSGFKALIDSTQWLAVRVVHALSDGGFTTQVELEMKVDDLVASSVDQA